MNNFDHKNNKQVTFTIGDSVIIAGTNISGYLVKIKHNKCYVEANGKEIQTTLDKISTKQLRQTPKKGKKLKSPNNRTLELDLHRYRKDEAIEELQNFLNNAILNDVNKIIIIHGHGTGIIKKAVQAFLSKSDHVASFKLDEMNTGQTIAYLR